MRGTPTKQVDVSHGKHASGVGPSIPLTAPTQPRRKHIILCRNGSTRPLKRSFQGKHGDPVVLWRRSGGDL